MTDEWITIRRPTKKDEDKRGYVWRKMSPTGQGGLAFASQVGPTIPWRHTDDWWRDTDDWEPPAESPQPEPEPTTRKVPRLFAAPPVRTWAPDGGEVLTALADDGTCWWSPGGEWRQIRPLPDREEPIDA